MLPLLPLPSCFMSRLRRWSFRLPDVLPGAQSATSVPTGKEDEGTGPGDLSRAAYRIRPSASSTPNFR